MRDKPAVGHAVELEPGIRGLLAPNPSPMTYWGTNTYLLGHNSIVVIDPGPDDPTHLKAILGALEPNQKVEAIVVTHAHKDHSPLAAPLAAHTGAPILAFGDASAGRSPIMSALAEDGFMGGGEGVDAEFMPTQIVQDGDEIPTELGSLSVIHTPGHFGNHISLALADICFTGDHVMGWASSLVSPPDGDLTDFMASCRRLQQSTWRRFFAGHGEPINDPQARLNWLINHRLGREAEILAALRQNPATPQALTRAIYTDVDPRLFPAAERNVFAHLVDLHQRGRVTTPQTIGFNASFQLA